MVLTVDKERKRIILQNKSGCLSTHTQPFDRIQKYKGTLEKNLQRVNFKFIICRTKIETTKVFTAINEKVKKLMKDELLDTVKEIKSIGPIRSDLISPIFEKKVHEHISVMVLDSH